MSLGSVSARFFVGAGAWLLGAAAATGGSLFAVSLLGQSLAPAPSQQLTVTAVNRALASGAAEGARSSSLAGPSASPTPSPRHATARRPASAATSPAAATPAASPAPQATSVVLTSVGGTVVARCETGGAYLVSWSPQQGYQASHVFRGPTAKAKVTFANSHHLVIMAVTCAGGVPSAATTIHRFDE